MDSFTLKFYSQIQNHSDGNLGLKQGLKQQAWATQWNPSLQKIFLMREQLYIASFTLPPMSPVFVPFKNGFNAAGLWCCLHITLKRSKMEHKETVMLTVRLNEP